jgi:predicted ATPase
MGDTIRCAWSAADKPRIDNLRAALDWAFSPRGDASIGVTLTVLSVPLWMHSSLLNECRGRVEQALSSLGPTSARDMRTRCGCMPHLARR